VSNCRGTRHKGKEGHQNNKTGMWQAYQTKINRNFGKIAGRFYIFIKRTRWERFQIFRNIRSNFGTNIP